MGRQEVVGVRLYPQERKALENAANAEGRQVSTLARLVISDWLRRNGWMGQRALCAESDDESDIPKSER